MKIEKLIKSAKKLQAPSIETCNEYSDKKDILASEINKIMSSRLDINDLIGQGNLAMMEHNHRNHARFIESILLDYDAEVLVNTVIWVFRAYRCHGFNLTYWPAQLDIWIELFKKHLSEKAYKEIYPFYNWMLIHQPDFALISDNFINDKYYLQVE